MLSSADHDFKFKIEIKFFANNCADIEIAILLAQTFDFDNI